MDDDVIEAECLRTLARGAIDESFRYSRRHRWKPLTYDIDGDRAVVVVATRGKRRNSSITSHSFERHGATWEPMGTGGGSGDDTALPQRPPAGPPWLETLSMGSETRRRGPDVHDALLIAAQDVTTVEHDGRSKAVADHGCFCVIWHGHAYPRLRLGNEATEVIQEVDLRDLLHWPEPPLALRMLARLRRTPAESWFNYEPRRRDG